MGVSISNVIVLLCFWNGKPPGLAYSELIFWVIYLISQCSDVFLTFRITMFLHGTICLSLVSTKLPLQLLILVTIILLLFQQRESQNRMSCLLSFSLIKEAVTVVRIWQIFPVTSLSPFLYYCQPFSFLCVLEVLNEDAFFLMFSTELISTGLSVQKGAYTALGQQANIVEREDQWAFTRKGEKLRGFFCVWLCNGANSAVVCQTYRQNIRC